MTIRTRPTLIRSRACWPTPSVATEQREETPYPARIVAEVDRLCRLQELARRICSGASSVRDAHLGSNAIHEVRKLDDGQPVYAIGPKPAPIAPPAPSTKAVIERALAESLQEEAIVFQVIAHTAGKGVVPTQLAKMCRMTVPRFREVVKLLVSKGKLHQWGTPEVPDYRTVPMAPARHFSCHDLGSDGSVHRR